MNKRPGLLKRPFKGVQAETIDKVAAQVAAAESAVTHEYEMRHVPLAHVQLWEDQPRTFHLVLDDIYRGRIDPNDPLADVKAAELEGIIGLAMSQREFGMLNAPLAYALPGKRVQLMGGQRRTMAAIFALFHIRTTVNHRDIKEHDVEIDESPDLSRLESERIVVKVFGRKPDDLTLERVGMVDNVQRTELPISDKLRWLVKFADRIEGRGREVHWRDLVDTMGLSRSQAYEWLTVVQARRDPWIMRLLERVMAGTAPFARLAELAKAPANDREALFEAWYGQRPAPDTAPRVSLGATTNLSALRSLVLSNVEGEMKVKLESIDWQNPRAAKRAFADFLTHWEAKHG